MMDIDEFVAKTGRTQEELLEMNPRELVELYTNVYDENEAVYGKKLKEAPAFLAEGFVPGFGPIEMIECPNCGEPSEQYTKRGAPTQYYCRACKGITSHLGAEWYFKSREERKAWR